MADFRKWLLALAVAGLFAGFSAPANAQVAAFNCQATVGVPPIVRQEGLTELVGDVTLDCTGGIPTPIGKAVPPVDITVFLSQFVTSKITNVVSTAGGTVSFDEALLIIDEPHSASHPAINLLNCGQTAAPDTGSSGPGVCSIISDGNPADTYNGTAGFNNGSTTLPCDGAVETTDPAAGSYGCGHPNVFQGRQGSSLVYSPNNSVTFAGVPIDPPGTANHRIIRITNVRVNANGQGIPNGLFLAPITMQISINGNTSMGINNPTQTVAYVEPGLACPENGSNCGSGAGAQFLQCIPETNAATNTSLTFQEGFLSSWKARNISFIDHQGDSSIFGNGVLQAAASYWTWNGTLNTPADVNQNVPGAIYNTEAGFMYPSTTGGGAADIDPSPNPPDGVGTVKVTSVSNPFYNKYNGTSGTNISAAGVATQGTRLVMKLNNIPTNTTVQIPTAVALINTAGIQSGAMVLISGNNANGAGGTFVTSPSTGSLVTASANQIIVYEIVFADPFSLESAIVPFYVTYAITPVSALAQTGVTATVTGAGFAPFYASGGQFAATTAAFPIPRFVPGTGPTINLYTINKCTCNILFPFVISTSGFDTGIAIANTSNDPGTAAGYNPGAASQTGSVTLWMYGSNAAGADASKISPQCTNAASPGTCPNGAGSGPTNIPAGQVLLYAMSGNNTAYIGGNPSNLAGLDNRWAGYIGYMIAQTEFQYCHAYAFISSPGLANGTSEGYLGLILDNNALNCKGSIQNPVTNLGLCRTGQQGEELAH